MKKLLIALAVMCQVELRSAIYDCFPFFNELELLHIRFAELYDVVDQFVIIEGKKSFTGREKPLYFLEHAAEYEKYKDKITHLVVEDFPGLTGSEDEDHWKKEAYSRNFLLEGLKNCDQEDIIFISDADEIPSADAVQQVKRYFEESKNRKRKGNASTDVQLVVDIEMRLFMYQLNRERLSGWSGGCKAAPYWLVKKLQPWGIKLLHHTHPVLYTIKNGGWHFNTMGGQERALYKWLLTGPYSNEDEQTLLEMTRNKELLNESYQKQVEANTILVPLDSNLPRYLLDNIEYFESIGWIANE